VVNQEEQSGMSIPSKLCQNY